MAEVRKKAKLAHEKALRTQTAEPETLGAFAVKAVHGIVIDDQNIAHAWVDLDEVGTMGLVSPLFARTTTDGSYEPAPLACPATYDAGARSAAVAAYERVRPGSLDS